MNKEAKIIEETYFDKCSIFRKEKIKNPDTGVTETKDVEVYKDIKCGISRGGQVVASANGINIETNTTKLYTYPDIIIEAGDTIKVIFENRMTASYEASSPFYYPSNTQCNLTEKERA